MGPPGRRPDGFTSLRSVNFDLTDEQALIKQTAREFTDKEVVPRAGENSRNHHFDLELVRKIADQGYLGAIVPHEYGGAGLDYLTYALVCEEIGRGCSAMRTVISVGWKPSWSASTRKQARPLCCRAGSVWANTSARRQ